MSDDAEKIVKAGNKTIWWTGCLFWVVAVLVGAGALLGSFGPSTHTASRSVPNPVYHPPTSTPVSVHVSQRVGNVGHGLGVFLIVIFGAVLVIVVLTAIFK